MANFYLKVGNLSPAITATLTDDAGDPVDLTGATVIFKLVSMLDYTTVVAGSADILVADPDVLQAGDPNVRYRWQGADSATPGLYYAEWQATLPSGAGPITFPNTGFLIVNISPTL